MGEEIPSMWNMGYGSEFTAQDKLAVQYEQISFSFRITVSRSCKSWFRSDSLHSSTYMRYKVQGLCLLYGLGWRHVSMRLWVCAWLWGYLRVWRTLEKNWPGIRNTVGLRSGPSLNTAQTWLPGFSQHGTACPAACRLITHAQAKTHYCSAAASGAERNTNTFRNCHWISKSHTHTHFNLGFKPALIPTLYGTLYSTPL